jgi:hypothetical protein
MQSFIRCNDYKLARWLLSNPVSGNIGSMTVVCGGAAFHWPLVPPDDVAGKEVA